MARSAMLIAFACGWLIGWCCYNRITMDYDKDKVDEAVLALLYLTLHEVNQFGGRAWKSHDWDALDRLHEKARTMRASIRVYSTCSVLDFRRQLAAIGRELRHHLLVQPDIHARGIIGVAGIAELLGKLLPRGKTGIDVERLHQVDD